MKTSGARLTLRTALQRRAHILVPHLQLWGDSKRALSTATGPGHDHKHYLESIAYILYLTQALERTVDTAAAPACAPATCRTSAVSAALRRRARAHRPAQANGCAGATCTMPVCQKIS